MKNRLILSLEEILVSHGFSINTMNTSQYEKPECMIDKIMWNMFFSKSDSEIVEHTIVSKQAFMKELYPSSDEHFGESYDFEIFAKLQPKGWTLGEGNRFIEVLSYQTKNSIRNPLIANHPMADYVASALVEMRRFLKEKAHEIVRQEFIDNAPKSSH